MTLRRHTPFAAALVALLAACGSGPDQEAFYDIEDAGDTAIDALPADTGATDTAPDTDDDVADDAADADVEVDTGPPPYEWDIDPAFVTLDLAPLRALYAPDLTVTLTPTVYDVNGDVIPDAPVEWVVGPVDAAAPGEADGDFVLLTEGEVTFQACVLDPPVPTRPVCGRRALMVDASIPSVEILRPAPGAMLARSDDALIRVNGIVNDTNGRAQVFVNGDRVAVGRDGSFSAAVQPRFGINHIDVVASDGLNATEGRAALDVLWAEDYLPQTVEDTAEGPLASVSVADAIALVMRQDFIDDGDPLRIDPEDPVVTAEDLATVVELVLHEVDLMTVIPDPVSDSEDLTLSVLAADLGPTVVDLSITDEGLDLFVSLPAIRVETDGFFRLGDVELSLEGGFEASMAATIALTASKPTPEDDLVVELGEVQLALEDARGFFVAPEANAILEVVEGLLFRAVENLLVDAVSDAFVSEVPALIDDGLRSVEDLLTDVRFPLDLGFGDPTTLWLDGAIATVVPVRANDLTASLDLAVGAYTAPAFEDARGVPLSAAVDDDPEPFSDGNVVVQVRLPVVNALLYSLWNAGLIDIDISDQIPPEFALFMDRASVAGRLPPVVSPPGPDRAEWDLVITIGQLEATLGRGDQEDVLGLSLSTGVRLRVDDDNVLRIEVQDAPSIEIWTVSIGGAEPLFPDPEGLRGVIQTLVWGELVGAITGDLGVPLPALSFDGAADIAPTLDDLVLQVVLDRALELRGGFVYVYAGLIGSADLSE